MLPLTPHPVTVFFQDAVPWVAGEIGNPELERAGWAVLTLPPLAGNFEISNVRNGHSGTTQVKCNRGDIALSVFPGKERPPGFGRSRVFRLPPRTHPKGRGEPSGYVAVPLRLLLVGAAHGRGKSLRRLSPQYTAKAERRATPLQDSAQPGFSFFGRELPSPGNPRSTPSAFHPGTRATLPSSRCGGY